MKTAFQEQVSRILAWCRTGACILAYHRVAELATDHDQLAVTPEQFRQQMSIVRRHYRVMGVADLTAALCRGQAPGRAMVVTFDDGYADNFTHALHILEEFEVPATVFVTADMVGSARAFWWDELDSLISSAGAAAGVGPVPQDLHSVLKTLPAPQRDRMLRDLAARQGVARENQLARTALTHTQLKQLAAHPLIEIGAHTLSHPQLSALNPQEQDHEITQGKRVIEAWLGRSVNSFSYPFGGRRDWNATTRRLVQTAGFSAACTTVPGLVTRACDPLALPRCLVRAWSGAAFQQRLAAFSQEAKRMSPPWKMSRGARARVA